MCEGLVFRDQEDPGDSGPEVVYREHLRYQITQVEKMFELGNCGESGEGHGGQSVTHFVCEN